MEGSEVGVEDSVDLVVEVGDADSAHDGEPCAAGGTGEGTAQTGLAGRGTGSAV